MTWFVVFLLVWAALSFDLYPSLLPGRPMWVDVVSGTVSSLLFFTSLVAHELSHSLVARRFGIRVERITLFLFGGIAQLADEPRTPGRELRMAVAGPAASLALSAAFAAAGAGLAAAGAGEGWWAPAAYLSVMNLALALFNMAPGFPMDGGRVLRAYLWWATGDKRRSTFAASCGGVLLAVVMAATGGFLALQGDPGGLWLCLVGLFLGRLAAGTYRRQRERLSMTGTSVGSLPLEPLPLVPRGTLSSAAAGWATEARSPLLGVAEDGVLVGLVPLGAAVALAGTASTVADAIDHDPDRFIDVADSAETALRRFERGVSALVAVSASRAVGVLTPASLRRAIPPALATGAPRAAR